jgi:hypothetical protein
MNMTTLVIWASTAIGWLLENWRWVIPVYLLWRIDSSIGALALAKLYEVQNK